MPGIKGSGIVEHISDKSENVDEPAPFSEAKTQHQLVPAKPATATPPKTPSRSSFFKYYIHDTTEAFRLQLFGELTEPEISELNGCWRTAKITLANRKLLLDLRGLKAVDDAGKQWLASMSTEGASYLPETYLKTSLAGQGASPAESEKAVRKTTLFGKLIATLRLRVTAAESSTQAP